MFSDNFLNVIKDERIFAFLSDLPLSIAFDGGVLKMLDPLRDNYYSVGKTIYQFNFERNYGFRNDFEKINSYKIRSDKYYQLWIIVKFTHKSFFNEMHTTSELMEEIALTLYEGNYSVEKNYTINASEIKLLKEKLKDNPGLFHFI